MRVRIPSPFRRLEWFEPSHRQDKTQSLVSPALHRASERARVEKTEEDEEDQDKDAGEESDGEEQRLERFGDWLESQEVELEETKEEQQVEVTAELFRQAIPPEVLAYSTIDASETLADRLRKRRRLLGQEEPSERTDENDLSDDLFEEEQRP